MPTASEIFRKAAGIDPVRDEDEEEITDEEIEESFAIIDNIIKHAQSPHPLDDHGKPIPPPPSPKAIFEKRTKKKKKGGKRGKR